MVPVYQQRLRYTSVTPKMSLLPRLGKQVMANTPLLATIPGKQLRARQVEYLPPVEPFQRLLFSIGFLQVWPDLLLCRGHLVEPVIACLRVVLAIDPPLLLDIQVSLEEQQQVGRGHGAAGEEVLGHPP